MPRPDRYPRLAMSRRLWSVARSDTFRVALLPRDSSGWPGFRRFFRRFFLFLLFRLLLRGNFPFECASDDGEADVPPAAAAARCKAPKPPSPSSADEQPPPSPSLPLPLLLQLSSVVSPSPSLAPGTSSTAGGCVMSASTSDRVYRALDLEWKAAQRSWLSVGRVSEPGKGSTVDR